MNYDSENGWLIKGVACNFLRWGSWSTSILKWWPVTAFESPKVYDDEEKKSKNLIKLKLSITFTAMGYFEMMISLN